MQNLCCGVNMSKILFSNIFEVQCKVVYQGRKTTGSMREFCCAQLKVLQNRRRKKVNSWSLLAIYIF